MSGFVTVGQFVELLRGQEHGFIFFNDYC